MELTRNFTLQELIKSDTAIRKGINNNPNAEQIEREYKRKSIRPIEPGPGLIERGIKGAQDLFGSVPQQDTSIQQANIQTPPLPNTPMPRVQNIAQNIIPTTGLTQTESALLSPGEQLIRQRSRRV